MSKTLKDGEYTATVEGQEGQMTVKTTIADGKISAVKIVEQHETAGVADKAISDLPAGDRCGKLRQRRHDLGAARCPAAESWMRSLTA